MLIPRDIMTLINIYTHEINNNLTMAQLFYLLEVQMAQI